MSRAISREGYDELKNYLGVYLQQGRVILDSDWNESQDITAAMLKRLTREAVGNGSPNRGFLIDRIFPTPLEVLFAELEEALANIDTSGSGGGGSGNILQDIAEAIMAVLAQFIGICITGLFGFVANYFFGPLMHFIQFPGDLLDDCESLEGWALESPQGRLRIGRDVPFAGRGFLRLSGHAGTVRITRTLPAGGVVDLSAHEILIFRFRTNQQVPGPIRFFLEDTSGRRTTWTFNNPALARELWMAGFATPLDVRFRIVTSSLPRGFIQKADGTPFDFGAEVAVFGGELPVTWSVSAGSLPPGLSLQPSFDPDDSYKVRITGNPTHLGASTFTLRAVDATGAETTDELTLTIEQTAPTSPAIPIPSAIEFLRNSAVFDVLGGGAADPAHVARYGFELYQSSATPLVWDLDDLRVGSSALQESTGLNNFIIRGSELGQLAAQIALMGMFQESEGDGGPGEIGSDFELDLLEVLNVDFQLSNPNLENAGRMYVDGIPCVLVRDTLYSDQADPDDPPITTPAPGSGSRIDTVYLDVWEEPVTFVEDPEIREIALGGPDTSTRQGARFRVRVAQGGPMPTGDGRGLGRLATEGTFTGADNRLYRIEIETPGDIGTARFRWSDENGAIIGRVIDTIPAGSNRVLVEDGAGFHAGDHLLIRSSVRNEPARIASVLSNEITLIGPTAATFPLADRPRIERWNAFDVAIAADPADPMVSAAIPLNDGVSVRFGGRAMRRGDYWTFRTRYLAGDLAAGIDPDTRIEELGFVRPRGIRHRYAPLASITRHEDDGGRIFRIRDLRNRVGNASITDLALPTRTITVADPGATSVTEHLGGAALPPAGKESKFLVLLAGTLFITGPIPRPEEPELRLTVAFYNDGRTNPATDPDAGRIQDKQLTIPLSRSLTNVEIPLNLTFVSSDTPFEFLPRAFAPSFVEVFATLSRPGYSAELSSIRLTAIELKKTF
jgi:hypothetical protein